MVEAQSEMPDACIWNFDIGHARYPDGTTRPLEICDSCLAIMSSPEHLDRSEKKSKSGHSVHVFEVCEALNCFFGSTVRASIEAYNQRLGPGTREGKAVLQAYRLGSKKGPHDIDMLDLEFAADNGWHVYLVNFEVFPPPNDRSSLYLTSRAPRYDLASDEMFSSIKGWIDDCGKTHKRCPLLADTPLPTRVLDVGDPADEPRSLRLFETSGAVGKYVALSYCWGGPQQVALTTQTHTQMHQAIDLDTLPKTLQDAVFVTQKLGLRYLWIDALCIIQDSQADMEKELKTMALTYRNAAITISAASASTVHDGFLQPRHPKPSKYPRFKLPYRSWEDDSLPGSVIVQERIYHVPCADPISQRAWTLQERLLSPRLLVYSTHTLVWQCQTTKFTECGSEEMLDAGSERLEDAFFHADKPLDDEDFWYSWIDTVIDYTKRKVSFEQDRLVAIGGLASEFLRLSKGDTYLAGLWRRNLCEGLLWMLDPSVKQDLQPRPSAYLAPSWSWASVNGVVAFAMSTGMGFTAQVLSCEVTLESEAVPTGRVVGGVLRLRGPVREARWTGVTLWDVDTPQDGDDRVQAKGEETVFSRAIGNAWMDASDDSVPERVTCIRISGPRGLLVTPTESDIVTGGPVFRRVGLFEARLGKTDEESVKACDAWFACGGSGVQEIVIV
ncbi:HET domain containing protein [Naviculisporaceae sp. PSN 640]